MEEKIYGTVISTANSPSTQMFMFVVRKNVTIHRNQFVSVRMGKGKLIGRIVDIYKTNRYFMHPESVEKFEESGRNMDELFPIEYWEYLVAEVRPIGIFENDGKLSDVTYPPSPGDKVFEPECNVLSKFFGMSSDGIHIGTIPFHNVDIKLDLSKLFQKHVAILAMSGAGKSYLMSVMLEELMERNTENGQIGVVVIDTHGEYVFLAEDENYTKNIRLFRANDIRIRTSDLSIYSFFDMFPSMSYAQQRELAKIIKELKDKKINYSVSDVINAIDTSEQIKGSTKDVLLSYMNELLDTGFFSTRNYPTMEELSVQGKVSIIDLSNIINLKQKHILVWHFAKNLFKYRRQCRIPPTLLVIEEAHQYVPSDGKRDVDISKPIIETIAREGRKFNICLCMISQRPMQISTTALSQCNTHIILRITNPYDLDHIGKSSEGITRDVQNQITNLKVGYGFIVGEAVNFPMFIKVRRRRTKKRDKSINLKDAAIEYYKRYRKKMEEARAFM